MAKAPKDEDEPKEAKKTTPKGQIPDDPKEPYPTGNPPSADDEKRRAAGLPPDAPL